MRILPESCALRHDAGAPACCPPHHSAHHHRMGDPARRNATGRPPPPGPPHRRRSLRKNFTRGPATGPFVGKNFTRGPAAGPFVGKNFTRGPAAGPLVGKNFTRGPAAGPLVRKNFTRGPVAGPLVGKNFMKGPAAGPLVKRRGGACSCTRRCYKRRRRPLPARRPLRHDPYQSMPRYGVGGITLGPDIGRFCRCSIRRRRQNGKKSLPVVLTGRHVSPFRASRVQECA